MRRENEERIREEERKGEGMRRGEDEEIEDEGREYERE